MLAIRQWDPLAEIDLFDALFRTTPKPRTQNLPAVDIREDDNAWGIYVELAGMKAEDIKVAVENKVLTISGKRGSDQDGKGFHRMERFFGSFGRSFTLPDEVNTEEIEAKYDNGVLTLRLPKRSSTKRREIVISAGS